MNVDFRRFRKAYHTVSVEIALHRSTVLDRDLSVQCGGQAEDDGALGLLSDGPRINHVAGIERDSDSIDLHLAIRLDQKWTLVPSKASRPSTASRR